MEIVFDAAAHAVLDRVAAVLPATALPPNGKHDVELLLAGERCRTTLLQGKRPQTTYSRDGSRSIVFWDHALRGFAALEGVADACLQFEESRRLDYTRSVDGGNIKATVEIDDARLGLVRTEFTFSRDPELQPFAKAVLDAIHCGCAEPGHGNLPLAQLAEFGCLIEQRTYVAEFDRPATKLRVTGHELVEINDAEFGPPSGFIALTEALAKAPQATSDPVTQHPQGAFDRTRTQSSAALMGVPRLLNQNLTPDCIGSTRFGAMVATIHQDAIDHVVGLLNLAAPMLGLGTLAPDMTQNTFTILTPTGVTVIPTRNALSFPWLATLQAAHVAASVSPGAGLGLFTFLRDPRRPSTALGPKGGTGLLDHLAFRMLTEADAANMTRLQRENAAGTISTTLTAWGVSPAAFSRIVGFSGDFRRMAFSASPTIRDEALEIVEAFETKELGALTLHGIPLSITPLPDAKEFVSFTVGRLSGTVNFGALAGPLISGARIGSTGNILMTVALPAVTFSASVTANSTLVGKAVAVGTGVAVCLLMPFACPLGIAVASVAMISINNAPVTISGTGLTAGLDISFAFDPTTERVEPFVTVTSQTGSVVATTPSAHGVTVALAIVNMLGVVVAGFSPWRDLVLKLLAGQLESALRVVGVQLPVAGRQLGLQAVSGDATSDAGSLLTVRADVGPIAGVAAQPQSTQTATLDQVRDELKRLHLDFRTGANAIPPPPLPPTPPPPPGTLATITTATYLGLGVGQNALNYYLYTLWLQGAFRFMTTDPILLKQVESVAPPGLFARAISQLHLWSATPPRAEVSLNGLSQHHRPLVVFFDDVRACGEMTQTNPDMTNLSMVNWELSFNFKTAATLRLGWPFVFDVLFDETAATPIDPRTFELLDLNNPAVMTTLPLPVLTKFGEILAPSILGGRGASKVAAPTSPAAWTRRFPALQQLVEPEVIVAGTTLPPQRLYLEMLGHRHTLYVLPALSTTLLELVDGSGMPTINSTLLGNPTPPATLATLSAAQGVALRQILPASLGPSFP